MIIVRCLFLMLFVTCFYGSDALAAGNSAPLASHNFFTPELKPSPDAFKLAKSTFLPETYDDLGLSGRHNTKYDFNKNDCSSYTLASCPAHGNCTKCPFDSRKLKLNSCDTGFALVNSKCLASSCSSINSSYVTEVPTGKICTKVTEGGLTCFKDCRNVSCSGYTLNCDTFNVPYSASKTTCPDCESANANCSPKLCKVGSCQTGYKIADNGTSCVALDDTCPNGYYKECETGTQGDPEFTEKGTACYQCKPNADACPEGYFKSSACPYGTIDGSYVKNEAGKYCYKCKPCPKGYYTSCRHGYTDTREVGDKSENTCYRCIASVICRGALLNTSICNGKANTAAMSVQYHSAADACTDMYLVSQNHAVFGAGKWYVPAVGELMDAYGYDIEEEMTATTWGLEGGALGGNAILTNIDSASYWTSSEAFDTCGYVQGCMSYNYDHCKYCRNWYINFNSGTLFQMGRSSGRSGLRCFNHIENKFSTTSHPQIGDVLYTDLTYSSYNDSVVSTKEPAGYVTWVSEDKKSVKIMTFKDLVTKATGTSWDIDSANPFSPTLSYEGQKTYSSAWWASSGDDFTDYEGVDTYPSDKLLQAIKRGY